MRSTPETTLAEIKAIQALEAAESNVQAAIDQLEAGPWSGPVAQLKRALTTLKSTRMKVTYSR